MVAEWVMNATDEKHNGGVVVFLDHYSKTTLDRLIFF